MIETPHIKANKEDIAKIVLMPGDPLRAKFIAETYLEDYKLVNDVRNMLAYTGYYKGTRITVFPSGMGIPSMAIYCYELYKYFDVDYILRIGSSGSTNKDIDLLDIVLSTESYTESNYARIETGTEQNTIKASSYMDDIILSTAKDKNVLVKTGRTLCTVVFDAYVFDYKKFCERLPEDIIASEMEAFPLFYTANYFKKQAACITTVADAAFDNRQISPDDRLLKLNLMIELALDSAIKFEVK